MRIGSETSIGEPQTGSQSRVAEFRSAHPMMTGIVAAAALAVLAGGARYAAGQYVEARLNYVVPLAPGSSGIDSIKIPGGGHVIVVKSKATAAKTMQPAP